jgi:integrase
MARAQRLGQRRGAESTKTADQQRCASGDGGNARQQGGSPGGLPNPWWLRRLTGPSRLASAMDPRYTPLVLLGGYGGLRIGEMLALRWSRVDLDRGRIEVVEGLTDLAGTISFGPPKTKAAIRSLTVPRFVVTALTSLSGGNADPKQLVFRSSEGHAVRPGLFRRRFWNTAVIAADLALWIAAGANPKQIAIRAGHTSVSVVLDRYGHLFPEQDDALMSALERAVSGLA